MIRVFSDKTFNKTLFRLALPLVLQSLLLATVAAADAIMLGKLDQNSMSAVSLATQFQFLQNMEIFAVAGAFLALGSQYWGKGDVRSVSDVFVITLRVNTIMSFVFFVGTAFFPEKLMTIFTNQPKLIEIGAEYLKIAGFSYLLVGISQTYISLLKVTDKAKYSAIISGTTVIINIILNAVLIFGLFGLPEMGVRGAALATLLSRIIELVWCVLISLRNGFVRPDLRRIFMHFKGLSHDFFVTVMPLVGAVALWAIGFSSYSSFMGHLGEDAAAANSVAAVIRDLVCCLCDGLAAAGGIVVGNELGRGNLEKGKENGIKMAIIGFLCGLVSTILMLLSMFPLLAFVKISALARHYLIQMMLVLAFYMIGRSVNTIIVNGVFAAGGDTKFDAYSLAVTMWGLAVPLAALGTYVFGWPVVLVYGFTCLDEVGKIPWTMYHFRKYKWVKDLTR